MTEARFTRSFSDPDGHVEILEDCVYRHTTHSAMSQVKEFLSHAAGMELLERGSILGYQSIDESRPDVVRLTHQRIWFPTFPYEWTALQLHTAARLTLDIEDVANSAGFELKDASPYNILFDGSRPVFVDLLSLQRQQNERWYAYGQFVREFILPLIGSRYLSLPIDAFFICEKYSNWGSRLNRALSLLIKCRPTVFLAVVLPSLFMRNRKQIIRIEQNTSTSSRPDADKIARSLMLLVARYQHRSVTPTSKSASQWSKYRSSCMDHYSVEDRDRKLRFVKDKLHQATCYGNTVIDLGTNDGTYSLMAAGLGLKTVAVDSDEDVLMNLQREATTQTLSVTTVLMDMARPSPAVGWRNCEFPSFLCRTHKQFDLVLMLAVTHHLLVSSRIPLEQILSFARHCCRKAIVIEYIDPKDSRFIEIAGVNIELYRDLSREVFERCLSDNFTIMEVAELKDCQRILYYAEVRH